ncbi:MAG: hypothetical protein HGB17_04690, partial [Syntrophobacteraceae bacterium]|nr:hypothetical protein [Syntrophobacteraceae bacterium]
LRFLNQVRAGDVEACTSTEVLQEILYRYVGLRRPDLAREVNKGFEGLKSLINRLLEQGKASGELKDETDTEAVTELIFAGLLGATVIYGVDKSAEKLDHTINSLLDYLDRLAPCM